MKKKFLAVLMAVSMVASVSACANREGIAVVEEIDEGSQAVLKDDTEKEVSADVTDTGGTQEQETPEAEAPDTEVAAPGTKEEALQTADLLAAGYDYDKAIATVKAFKGYESEKSLTEAISRYETEKASLVAVNPDQVTHIFYHSLVEDTTNAFTGAGGDGFNQWMTTSKEFKAITQQMYDNGYVLVRLRDLVEQTVDEDGTVHFKPATIMLPPDKKAFVMSMDDLSYYHSYDGRGIASKMVLDENGKPSCEYKKSDGSVVVGSYDYVPMIDEFLIEHPDGAYRGARPLVALTGYNGILGYRTDIAYKTKENLTKDQTAWLEANPKFDWDAEREEAKKVADAMREEGWEFASHTWGHRHIAQISLEELQADTEKWENYVSPLVGGTDTIVFAHGEDLSDWRDYTTDNEKFNYLKSKGYNFFCNVDSTQYWLQIRDNYVRQGRRNLDGYRMYNDKYGEENKTSDLFDVDQVYDESRPPVPDL